MKRLFTVLFGLALLLSFGCSSYDPFADLSLIDPMAIVRVSADTEIDWNNESNDTLGGSLLGGVANKVINDAKDEKVSTILSRSDLLVDQAEEVLRTSLEEVGTIRIVDRDAVLGSNAYSAVEDTRSLMTTSVIPAAGYKFFSNKGEESLASALEKETGAKSQIHAHFTFEKIMDTGISKNGAMGVSVELYIEMIDDEGKRIYSGYYWEQSRDTTPVVAGIYNPEDMMSLFTVPLEKVCREFAAEFVR